MKAIIISRKNRDGYGGLSRFFAEFADHYPEESLAISPANFYNLFKVPFKKFDIIYLCDATLLPLGIILKALFKKPLLITVHGLDLTFPNPFYQFLLKKALPKVDGIILDSQPAKKLMKSFNFPEEKIFVINPGISTNHLSISEKVKLPDIKNKIVLTTVGNLVLRKGHAWFIANVFNKLPDKFIYLVIGDGSERQVIAQTISKLHLKKRVFLLGQLTHQQLSFVFKKTDIYICPNQSISKNFESFGIANGEAAALGLPVVASKVDGIPDMIRNNKNGLVIKPSPAVFIDTILRLQKAKERQFIGSKARLFTAKFQSWEKTIQKYLAVFNEVSLGKI